jgi:hypothetical protein
MTIVEVSSLTLRITRPPAPLPKHDITRVAGRVHALVRPPMGSGLKLLRHQAASFWRPNAK